MHCTNCGVLLNEEIKFCPNCGTKVLSELQQHETKHEVQEQEASFTETTNIKDDFQTPTLPNETDEELLKRFIGKNSNYYMKKWSSSNNPNKRSGWNWAAFFLTVFWLGYRKMFKYMFLYIIIWVVLGIIFGALHLDRLTGLISIAIACSLGVSGNALYYTFAKENIQKHKNNQTQKALERIGGTGGAGVWIAIGAMLIYVMILSALSSSSDKQLTSGSSNKTISATSSALNVQTNNTDADAKAKADSVAKAKADAEAKAKADAKAKAEADAKAMAEADAKAKAEADTKAKAEAAKNPKWNVKDIYVTENGNFPLAVNLLKAVGDISQQNPTIADAGDVFKAPWNYYGKAVKFTGTVGIVQDYPPGSDNAQIGLNSEVVMFTDEGTIIDIFSMVPSGKIKVGDTLNVAAYPVGLVNVQNKMGGNTDQLAVVTNNL